MRDRRTAGRSRRRFGAAGEPVAAAAGGRPDRGPWPTWPRAAPCPTRRPAGSSRGVTPPTDQRSAARGLNGTRDPLARARTRSCRRRGRPPLRTGPSAGGVAGVAAGRVRVAGGRVRGRHGRHAAPSAPAPPPAARPRRAPERRAGGNGTAGGRAGGDHQTTYLVRTGSRTSPASSPTEARRYGTMVPVRGSTVWSGGVRCGPPPRGSVERRRPPSSIARRPGCRTPRTRSETGPAPLVDFIRIVTVYVYVPVRVMPLRTSRRSPAG